MGEAGVEEGATSLLDDTGVLRDKWAVAGLAGVGDGVHDPGVGTSYGSRL